MTKSERIFEEAVHFIPGGVNSPVRAFGSIGSTPRMIARASGAKMWDEDGKEYELEVLAELEYNGSRYLALVPADADAAAMQAAAEAAVAKHIEGKTVVKAICVPGKLVNLVVK